MNNGYEEHIDNVRSWQEWSGVYTGV